MTDPTIDGSTARRCTAIDPIHAAAMTDKKIGLGGRFTANLRVST